MTEEQTPDPKTQSEADEIREDTQSPGKVPGEGAAPTEAAPTGSSGDADSEATGDGPSGGAPTGDTGGGTSGGGEAIGDGPSGGA